MPFGVECGFSVLLGGEGGRSKVKSKSAKLWDRLRRCCFSGLNKGVGGASLPGLHTTDYTGLLAGNASV